jgi:hypothetical protein
MDHWENDAIIVHFIPFSIGPDAQAAALVIKEEVVLGTSAKIRTQCKS